MHDSLIVMTGRKKLLLVSEEVANDSSSKPIRVLPNTNYLSI